MLIKKLFSKKGQVSMEIGILIFASILVSTIASYYYISNYLNTHPENIGKTANRTINALNNVSTKYSNSLTHV
ncbi:class III signal peptide-containing protein [Methanothermococcus sp.]|uniref:class III signal peptide-containing protein n=1 Tax=Methanothermococcus sp. TaxID=2614238 RepID=UPI0025DA7842|nr:class III signal peptide-containing protein [Methanothermococcus sp.]